MSVQNIDTQKGKIVNFIGLVIAAATFLLIGSFHVVVIKCEYYFGKEVWPFFCLIGGLSLLISVILADVLWSVLVAVFGITCIWSIKELFEQEKRVQKGWFPMNPKRKKK